MVVDGSIGTGAGINNGSDETEVIASGTSIGSNCERGTSGFERTTGVAVEGDTMTLWVFALELLARERLFFSTGAGATGWITSVGTPTEGFSFGVSSFKGVATSCVVLEGEIGTGGEDCAAAAAAAAAAALSICFTITSRFGRKIFSRNAAAAAAAGAGGAGTVRGGMAGGFR